MEKQIIKAEDYGINPIEAAKLTKGLSTIQAERDLLAVEFEQLSQLELLQENIPKFKALRLKIQKNRTQGINNWHKVNKEFFLTGGKFVDAIKRKEVQVNEAMETKLMNAEKHFENLEKERVALLQKERVELIAPYLEDANLRDLSSMESDVWNIFLKSKKDIHQAEIDRIEKEKEEAIAKAEADRIKQEEIQAENERLKLERIEREKEIEKELQAQKTAAAKVEAEKQKEIDAAKAVIAKAEAEKQALLDAEKQKEEERIAKEKKAASAPDKAKVIAFMWSFNELEVPEMETKEGQKIIDDAKGLIEKIQKFLSAKAAKL